MKTPSGFTRASSWGQDVFLGLGLYYLTGLVSLCGALFGRDFVMLPKGIDSPRNGGIEFFFRFDGDNYRRIVRDGYGYSSDQRSLVAFFPAYPALARAMMEITGCDAEVALIAVAHANLAASFVLLGRYARLCRPDGASSFPGNTLLALGLLPSAFFLRMAYSESTFLLLTLLTLLGMEKKWPLPVIACLAGAATAARPVGIAVPLAFGWHLWWRSPTACRYIGNMLLLGPLACWGLLVYMIFQLAAFGDPLAFVRTQAHWRLIPEALDATKWRTLATMEPLWGTFISSNPRYWLRLDRHSNPLFSISAINPIFFGATFLLVLIGAWRRWLNGVEVVLSLSLLAIPYLTRAHEMAMASHARFALVVVPAFLVLGRVLDWLPHSFLCALLALSSVFQAFLSAEFAIGYLVL